MNLRRAMLLDRWVQILLVGIVLVLANILAARHFVRLDLTEGHVYTLSETSRRLMNRLENTLHVKVYFTGDLAPPYNDHERILVDKLQEFRAYSNGRMKLDVVDPSQDPELQAEARRFGIEPIRYSYRGRDRAELKRVYMGAAFVYGERQGALEAVTDVDAVEYDIARVILRLVEDRDPPLVGLTTGHGEVDLSQEDPPQQKLLQAISEHHRLVRVPLGGEEGVPEEVDALLVLGPQRPVSDRARYQLDQFLMRGGALAVFVSNFQPHVRTLRTREVFTGLEPLLGAYGIQVNRDLVIHREHNGRMALPVRQGRRVVRALVNTPLIPLVSDLDEDSLILEGIEQLLFPFASSLTVSETLPEELEATVLARLDSDGSRVQNIRIIDPAAFERAVPGEETGAWPLAVALTGTFTSAYANRSIPAAPAETPFGAAAVAPDDPASKITRSAPARLVVAGSHQAVLNNLAFMQNLVDWMCQDLELIQIRGRSAPLPPLQPPPRSTALVLKAANVLGPMLLLVLAGGIRWFVRRRGSYRMEAS